MVAQFGAMLLFTVQRGEAANGRPLTLSCPTVEQDLVIVKNHLEKSLLQAQNTLRLILTGNSKRSNNGGPNDSDPASAPISLRSLFLIPQRAGTGCLPQRIDVSRVGVTAWPARGPQAGIWTNTFGGCLVGRCRVCGEPEFSSNACATHPAKGIHVPSRWTIVTGGTHKLPDFVI